MLTLTHADIWTIVNQYAYPNRPASTYHEYKNGDSAIHNRYNSLILSSPHITFYNFLTGFHSDNRDVVSKILDKFYYANKELSTITYDECICKYSSIFWRSVDILSHLYKNYCKCQKKEIKEMLIEAVFSEGAYDVVHKHLEIFEPEINLTRVISGILNPSLTKKSDPNEDPFRLIKWFYENHKGSIRDRSDKKTFIEACVIRSVKTCDLKSLEWVMQIFKGAQNMLFHEIRAFDFFQQDIGPDEYKILTILGKFRSIRSPKYVSIEPFVMADMNNIVKWMVTKLPRVYEYTTGSLWIFLANEKYDILEFLYKHNGKTFNDKLRDTDIFLRYPGHSFSRDLHNAIAKICTQDRLLDWLVQKGIAHFVEKYVFLEGFHAIGPESTYSCIQHSVKTYNIRFLRYIIENFHHVKEIEREKILGELLGLADPKKELKTTSRIIKFLCRLLDHHTLYKNSTELPDLVVPRDYYQYLHSNINCSTKLFRKDNEDALFSLDKFFAKRYWMTVVDRISYRFREDLPICLEEISTQNAVVLNPE